MKCTCDRLARAGAPRLRRISQSPRCALRLCLSVRGCVRVLGAGVCLPREHTFPYLVSVLECLGFWEFVHALAAFGRLRGFPETSQWEA